MSPLVSPPNNLSPSPIMQMATGFWGSKTLMTAVELGVFTKISTYHNQSMTLKEFQNIIGIEEIRPAEAFTTALVSLGLLKLDKNNDGERTFANSQVSSVFLDKNKPTYIGDLITMFDERSYQSWGKL